MNYDIKNMAQVITWAVRNHRVPNYNLDTCKEGITVAVSPSNGELRVDYFDELRKAKNFYNEEFQIVAYKRISSYGNLKVDYQKLIEYLSKSLVNNGDDNRFVVPFDFDYTEFKMIFALS